MNRPDFSHPAFFCCQGPPRVWRLLEGTGLSGPTFGKLVALLRRYRDEPRGTVTIGGKTFEGNGTVLTIEKELIILQ